MNLLTAILACATCFGAPDATQTQGMNMGILSMLGVTGFVLGGLGGMMICFARRSRRLERDAMP